ncbi:tetratricopeptide repeat protein [Hyalangium versicolor]|uniref:tetratricopeptide repeat protein n=1 Tax=Hyalangium versicolor TaxID=2861190 RepID=UPI001CCD18F4|nr:hypothetical protein [Hyalangium versicolor]
MTQDEFEASIDGDFSEVRNELRTEQVTPVYDIWRSTYLRVRPEFESELREVHASLPEWVRGFLQLRGGSEIRREDANFESDGLFLDLHHTGDRTYAGYANIYRGLKTIALYVEDARFFITEQYDTFVDEYRIEGGELSFFRGDCGEDSSEAIDRHWEERVQASPEDHDLRRFLARQRVYDGEYHARRVGASAPGDKKRGETAQEAMAALDSALALDAENVRAWKQKGELYRLLDEPEQAAECFKQAVSLGAGPEVLQSLALVAFSVGRDDEALSWLSHIPAEHRSRLMYQLTGHLLAHAGSEESAAQAFAAALRMSAAGKLNPDAEALFRTGRADTLLTSWFDHVTPQLERDSNTATRALIVRDLVEWGEFFRIKMHHGFWPDRSRQLALDDGCRRRSRRSRGDVR